MEQNRVLLAAQIKNSTFNANLIQFLMRTPAKFDARDGHALQSSTPEPLFKSVKLSEASVTSEPNVSATAKEFEPSTFVHYPTMCLLAAIAVGGMSQYDGVWCAAVIGPDLVVHVKLLVALTRALFGYKKQNGFTIKTTIKNLLEYVPFSEPDMSPDEVRSISEMFGAQRNAKNVKPATIRKQFLIVNISVLCDYIVQVKTIHPELLNQDSKALQSLLDNNVWHQDPGADGDQLLQGSTWPIRMVVEKYIDVSSCAASFRRALGLVPNPIPTSDDDVYICGQMWQLTRVPMNRRSSIIRARTERVNGDIVGAD